MAAYKKSSTKNGMDLVFLENHKVPLVTIVLAVKAGAMTEDPFTNGLTHLWEHMFFKGNALLPNQEAFNQRVRELGIIFNGDTSAEKVRYFFTLPSVFLEEGIEFMATAIMSPLLDPTEIEKEREVVLNEYDRNASQPAFEFYKKRRQILYGKSDYLRDPLGCRKVITKASRQQLLDIKSKVFVPQNSCLLVSGDFDEKKVEGYIEKYFSKWQNLADWTPIEPPPFPSFPDNQELIMTHPDAKNVSISMTYSGPRARLSPQDTFAADMLIQLLGMRNGKMHQEYTESGLALAAGLSYYTQSQVGELSLYALTQPDRSATVKEMLCQEPLKWLEKNYFNKDQLEDARRQLTIDYKWQLNKPSEYITGLGFWWAVTGFEYYDTYIENLKRITLNEIQQFINTYLIHKPCVTSIFLSPKDAVTIGITDNSDSFSQDFLSRSF